LLTYEAETPVRPREGLAIVQVGEDFIDDAGCFREAYAASPGDLFLVRPDGYLAAIARAENAPALEAFLPTVGL
jgi:hypothetical protein